VLVTLLVFDGPGLSGQGGQVRADRPTVSQQQSPVRQNARQ